VTTRVRATIGRALTGATVSTTVRTNFRTAIGTAVVTARVGATVSRTVARASVSAAIGTTVVTTGVRATVGHALTGVVGLRVGAHWGFAHGWISLRSGGASSRRPPFLCHYGSQRHSERDVCAGQGARTGHHAAYLASPPALPGGALPDSHGRRPGGLAYLWVHDVDAMAAEFGTVVEDNPWARDTQLVDPDCKRIRVGTSTGSAAVD
jgi:hypothetical protein